MMSFATSYRCLGALIVVVFVTGVFSQWVIDDDGCRTPDRGTGKCTPIGQCQSMLNFIATLQKPIPSAITRRLQAYTCGSTSNGIKVCCPSDPINFGNTPFQLRSEPPDVSNHKNINLLPESCGKLDTLPRIVNGNDSALNEFPWMALLGYQKNNQVKFQCGGTIINKNYILTAAHCLEPSLRPVTIRVGEHSIKNQTDCERRPKKKIFCNPPVQDLDVQEIIIHPQYGGKNGNFVNDIGLIRVKDINLDIVNAKPVCLPIGVVRDWVFKRVIVTGWGFTNPYTRTTADILQKVSLPVADKETCAKNYKESNIILTNTQICAGGTDGKDSCGGDSGGPMLVPTPVGENVNIIYVQQGVVSLGPKICADPNYPGIYTAVKYYMDWILDTMKK